MADHPSSYKGTPLKTGELAWDDRASLHDKSSADGVLSGASAIRRGTFAEMIKHITMLPEEERGKYVIEKKGDREYSAEEAVALASRDDFPS
ncbi:hypothetical protein INR77_10795 [Erythrobacter sp. SCSIO 43205]|uniref:hypothetical protein n=1 Tax=Erythrobacter sp. SCSIO 43205 TaxID=2779361 RepID=UPI001CA993A6|nr:hypothetical protein [Erythrobacter sp. SCSIO 43205]UAB77298.1 hypothetical protein INR77_10795 [Erythrobacter sp. SCSIO 43205]